MTESWSSKEQVTVFNNQKSRKCNYYKGLFGPHDSWGALDLTKSIKNTLTITYYYRKKADA